MKFILMILVALSLISCGKGGSTSSVASGSRAQEEQGRESTPRSDGYLATTRDNEPELLNVTINEVVTISGGRITFNRPVTVQNSGSRMTCLLSIGPGEVWQFRETSSGLEINFPDGTKASLRPVGRMNGINGSWSWSGSKDGVRTTRRYAILTDRLIINQDCES